MEFSDLYGTWRLSASFAATTADVSRHAFVEVLPSMIRTITEGLVVEADCQISKKRNDFVVLVSNVRAHKTANGSDIDLQGIEASYKRLQIWRTDGTLIRVLGPQLLMELERA
jgi:hypothetical protein